MLGLFCSQLLLLNFGFFRGGLLLNGLLLGSLLFGLFCGELLFLEFRFFRGLLLGGLLLGLFYRHLLFLKLGFFGRGLLTGLLLSSLLLCSLLLGLFGCSLLSGLLLSGLLLGLFSCGLLSGLLLSSLLLSGLLLSLFGCGLLSSLLLCSLLFRLFRGGLLSSLLRCLLCPRRCCWRPGRRGMGLLGCVQRGRWLGLFRGGFDWLVGGRRRRRLYDVSDGLRRRGSQVLLRVRVQRLTWIGLQGLLLLDECHRWRWRRNFGHNRPAHYGGRGPGRSRGSVNRRSRGRLSWGVRRARACSWSRRGLSRRRAARAGSHHACFHRRYGSSTNHRSRRDCAGGDFHCGRSHGLRVHESCAGHGSNGADHFLIRIDHCWRVGRLSVHRLVIRLVI